MMFNKMVVEDKKALKTQLTTRVECKSLVIVIFLQGTLSNVQLIQFYDCAFRARTRLILKDSSQGLLNNECPLHFLSEELIIGLAQY